MNKQMILSVGMPRAGSGWYYNLTQDLVVASGGLKAIEIRTKYPLERFLTEVNCNLGTLSSYRLIPVMLPLIIERPYVIKLHAERRPLADLLITLGLIKSTYIYRDPRDALLSAYEYGQRMSQKGLENAFTPLTTIEKSIDFMESYVKYSVRCRSIFSKIDDGHCLRTRRLHDSLPALADPTEDVCLQSRYGLPIQRDTRIA